MKLLAITSLILLISGNGKPEGWEMFSKVNFESKYFEEVDAYFEVPTFDTALLQLEHNKVSLSGYFIPIEIDTIFVLSAQPFSSCFFCGGAGPETVAEVRMSNVPANLAPDSFVKVEGKLALNATDINYMNFILQDAKIIK